MGWERVVYQRKDLFDQVWAEPATHVAERIGISNVALAKVCRRLGIPLPGRGHWARKAAGRQVSKPRLPSAKPGTRSTYVRRRLIQEPADVEAAANIRAEVQQRAEKAAPLRVPDVLSDPHPLVARASKILQGRAGHLDGILQRGRCLDVVAHGEALDRALRIADSVIKALEACGHSIEVTDPEAEKGSSPPKIVPSQTLVHVGDSVVQIGISEAVDKVPLPLPEPRTPRTPFEYVPPPKREYEYRPTGRLQLRIKNVPLRGATQSWCDRRSKRVEDHLDEFVATVVAAAERQRLDRIEAEKRRQEQLAEEREQRAIKLEDDAYKILEKDLKTRLVDWRRAREVGAFSRSVRKRAIAAGAKVDAESTVGLWLEWADGVVDELEEKAVGNMQALSNPDAYHQLGEQFLDADEITMADVLGIFFTPIEDLIQQELDAEAREERE